MQLHSKKSNPKGLLCKLCESLQTKTYSLYKNNQDTILEILKLVCLLGSSDELCEYYVKRDVKNLLDN